MNAKIRNAGIITFICLFVFCLSGAVTMFAAAEEQSYYVCFSNQNYSIRNSNKMQYVQGEYVLKNVSLSSVIDFYVTDNSGMRWYDADNLPLKVEEANIMRYDVLFSPDEPYENGSRVSYRFYEPDSYSVTVDGETAELTYNPYNTAYDLYYLSSAYITADSVVAFGEERHTVTENGFYRILFTPEKTVNGNKYLFDENGNYGSGDDFKFCVYVEDAPQYYAVFENTDAPLSDTQIDGKNAVYMPRYENNVSAAEYRSAETFAPERDYGIKYRVYETNPDGSFRLIDDDNNEDTAISKITVNDTGWYRLSLTETAAGYISSFREEEKIFKGWYLAGEFNGYCFDNSGNIDLYEEYAFTEIQEDGEDYSEDYTQYIARLTVTEAQLKNGNVEFYITDGKTKFKDGADYIAVSIAGTYKIICSEEHTYGRGRNFRYVLEDEGKDSEELLIGSVNEFLTFAENCSKSADYSVGLKVYLTADIDFAGVDFVPVRVFSGTLYGGYHKLGNITYAGNGSSSLIETLTHSGLVERLIIENINLGEKTADNAGIVGTNYGKINGVTVTGRITGRNNVGGIVAVNGVSNTETGDSGDSVNRASVKNCTNGADIYGETFVGGICGSNTGDISYCVSDGNVSGIKTRSSSTVSEVGGIAGYSFGKIYGCTNTGAVTGGSSSRYAGGIAGLCVGEIYFSVNRGNVSSDRYAGGAVGYYGLRQNESAEGGIFGGENSGEQEPVGNYNIFDYLVNFGNVTANAYAGGIVGNVARLGGSAVSTRTLKIYNSASAGNIEADAGSYAGGIAGYAAGVDISGCLSSGVVQAKGLNGGNYVGGIAGYGGDVKYSMSSATLKGADFVGGIAGYASSAVIGCYTNAVLLPSDGALNVGGIAGFSADYSSSKNEFVCVAGNYYIGDFGGIAGIDYQSVFSDAAAPVPSGVLASAGALSPLLRSEFSREYWQGGNGFLSYPLLINFETAEECGEFGDGQLFADLFGENAEMLSAVSKQAAALTYTVTFMEWNKDNGDLYDGGELQTDNFEIVASFRVTGGENAEAPRFKFAQLNANGNYVCDGGDTRYFVSFPEVLNVNGNITVYAEYREVVTSLTDSENLVFAEGEFVKGSEILLVKIGDFCAVKITLDGEEINVGNITVKYYVGDNAEKFKVYDGGGNEISSFVSGGYVCFDYTSGDYFKVEKQPSVNLAFWAWLLIGMAIAAAVSGGTYLTVFLIKRKSKKNSASK